MRWQFIRKLKEGHHTAHRGAWQLKKGGPKEVGKNEQESMSKCWDWVWRQLRRDVEKCKCWECVCLQLNNFHS